jgi:hypothetical protein
VKTPTEIPTHYERAVTYVAKTADRLHAGGGTTKSARLAMTQELNAALAALHSAAHHDECPTVAEYDRARARAQ